MANIAIERHLPSASRLPLRRLLWVAVAVVLVAAAFLALRPGPVEATPARAAQIAPQELPRGLFGASVAAVPAAPAVVAAANAPVTAAGPVKLSG
jgi:hypothetical protein